MDMGRDTPFLPHLGPGGIALQQVLTVARGEHIGQFPDALGGVSLTDQQGLRRITTMRSLTPTSATTLSGA